MKFVYQLMLLLMAAHVASSQEANEVQFKTEDGLTIYGDLYFEHTERPMVLLFHQAGSCARGEYESIVPVLTKNRYNVLAIDQRSGGSKLGATNRTVAHLGGKLYEYCETYPDFEAALAYVRSELNYAGKVVAWGSSYSASMVVRLKANNPDQVAAVLAFSPASGGPMKPCSPNASFEALDGQGLILRPAREMEIPSVRDQLAMAKAAGLMTFVSKNGVHGSSMLNPERVGGDTKETWEVVLNFLKEI